MRVLDQVVGRGGLGPVTEVRFVRSEVGGSSNVQQRANRQGYREGRDRPGTAEGIPIVSPEGVLG